MIDVYFRRHCLSEAPIFYDAAALIRLFARFHVKFAVPPYTDVAAARSPAWPTQQSPVDLAIASAVLDGDAIHENSRHLPQLGRRSL